MTALAVSSVSHPAQAQDTAAAPSTDAPTAVASPEGEPAADKLGTSCVADRFIVLDTHDVEPALAAEVRTDFATELRHRGLDVCDANSTAREPAALVSLDARDSMVIIQLDDRVTHKRVARDLPLAGIPQNGRALAIAIAIDELLRASWAELTLARARADAGDADEDSLEGRRETQPVSARGRADAPLRAQLGGDLGYLHAVQSFDAFTMGARGSLRPWGWGWFELGVGALGSLPAESPRGDVIAVGLRTSLLAGACSHDDAAAFGCLGARVGVAVLSLRGLRPEMARAESAAAAVVDGSLVGLLGVRLKPGLSMFGELGIGGVLHGAKATDGTVTVLGVTGLLLSLSLGMGFDVL